MHSWNKEIIDNYYKNELDRLACDVLKWTYQVDNEQESSLSDMQKLEKAALKGKAKLIDGRFISSMVGTDYRDVHDIIAETPGGCEVCLYTCLEVVGRELAELKASRIEECRSSAGCGYLAVDHRGRNLVLVKLKDVLDELCDIGEDVKVVLVCTNGVMSIHSHKRGG